MANAVKVRIRGQVQGVFFRAWIKEKANELGIQGWVRNRLDGTVEALFVADKQAVDEMVKAVREGPPNAKVDGVTTESAPGLTEAGFRVKPTV